MKMVNRNSDNTEQYSPFIVIMYEYLLCEMIRVRNGPNYKMRIYLDEKLVFSKIVHLTEGLKIVEEGLNSNYSNEVVFVTPLFAESFSEI